MAQPQLKSYRFRAEREWEWRRLERLLERMEKGSPANLSDDELLAVPVLYRSALSALSVARATSLDKSLIEYLESLCARAYFFVYGARSTLWERLGGFFSKAWPAAVKSLWRETLVSFAIVLLSAVAAYLLVSQDADWFYAVIPQELAAGRDPTATAAELRQTLGGAAEDEPLSAFATFLFTHNAQIALLAFALGFAFCVPTVLLLSYNGLMLGAFVALFVEKGLGVEAGGWLIIHGATEFFAVILAGAAGLRIGWTLAMPGERPRLDAVAEAGRTAATVMGGVVVMLLIAGLLEGFGRQLIEPTPYRFGVGVTSLGLWLTYFYLPRGRDVGR